MSSLDARAERLKFARLLQVDDEHLAFLEALAPDRVRAVRERVSQQLFDQGKGQFTNLVKASRLVPNALAARIAQRVFPPLVCAQVAGLIEPDHAAGLVSHFEVGFLCDVAAHTDPRDITHLVGHMPVDVLVAAARELTARKDYLTAGRFVGVAPSRVLPDLVNAVPDPADLLPIAFFLEAKYRLDEIVDAMPDDRLAGAMVVAAEQELWPEALSLMIHVGEDNTRRVAKLAGKQPDVVLTSLLRTTHREQLWDDVWPLVRYMTDDGLARAASVPALQDPDVLTGALDSAGRIGEYDTAVRVLAAMTPEAQQAVSDALPDPDPKHLAGLGDAARGLGLRDRLGAIGDRLPD
jgi:hypothetical protein